MDAAPDSVDWAIDSGIPLDPGALAAGRFPPGTRIGGYVVHDLLGRGATGAVCLARGPGGRQVALKLLTPAAGQEARARFVREGRLLASLQHPGIVRVYDAGEAAGLAYLASEWVEGGVPLDQAWAGSSLANRVRLLREVADAVGHAHGRGVVHRDLKPANVLVDRVGRARLIDFGAGFAAEHERLTRSGALVGTPLYMAPEQAAASSEAIGPACDVWALGVLLYVALTEQLPFQGANLADQLALIRGSAPPPPSARAPDVPPALEAICLRALRRDPGGRYSTGGEFAEALAAAVSVGGPTAGRSSSWAWALAGALGLGLGACVAVWVAGAAPGDGGAARSAPPPAPRREDRPPLPSSSLGPERLRALLLERARAGRWDEARGALDALLASRAEPPAPRVGFEQLSQEWDTLRRGHDPALLQGYVELLSGEAVAALKTLDAVIRRQPRSATALSLRASVLLVLGEEQAGRADLDACLRLDPQDWRARHNRARQSYQEGRYDDALEDAQVLVAVRPEYLPARVLRAEMHAALGDPAAAAQDVGYALRAGGGDPAFAAWLDRNAAVMAVELGSWGAYEACLKLLDPVLARDPRDIRALAVRGRVRSLRGDPDGARRDWTAALDAAPPDWAEAPQIRRQLEELPR